MPAGGVFLFVKLVVIQFIIQFIFLIIQFPFFEFVSVEQLSLVTIEPLLAFESLILRSELATVEPIFAAQRGFVA